MGQPQQDGNGTTTQPTEEPKTGEGTSEPTPSEPPTPAPAATPEPEPEPEPEPTPEEILNAAIRRVIERLDADILIFTGGLSEPRDAKFITLVENREKRRKNVFLVLTTYGGDPDVAYKMARTLQHQYEKFIAFVPGYCKSAGTLIVLGAHELVMAPHAELGPLDIQVRDRTETNNYGSALTLGTALGSLESRMKAAYRAQFEDLRDTVRMGTKLAAQTATMIVTRMYAPLLSQIDPMLLGEFDRANQIAIKYGQRLIERSKNTSEDDLFDLVTAYPSHSFVIDKHEAKKIFKRVRQPTKDERLFYGARNLLNQRNSDACFYWDVDEEEADNVEPGAAGPTEEGRVSAKGADRSPQRN
jgi:Serine dehydrogenase proteinase